VYSLRPLARQARALMLSAVVARQFALRLPLRL